METSFKTWLEELATKHIVVQDMIVGFLKNQLNIDDEETILNMNTNAINHNIIQDMLSRGMINSKKQEATEMIKNGISISDLIDFLSK